MAYQKHEILLNGHDFLFFNFYLVVSRSIKKRDANFTKTELKRKNIKHEEKEKQEIKDKENLCYIERRFFKTIAFQGMKKGGLHHANHLIYCVIC